MHRKQQTENPNPNTDVAISYIIDVDDCLRANGQINTNFVEYLEKRKIHEIDLLTHTNLGALSASNPLIIELIDSLADRGIKVRFTLTPSDLLFRQIYAKGADVRPGDAYRFHMLPLEVATTKIKHIEAKLLQKHLDYNEFLFKVQAMRFLRDGNYIDANAPLSEFVTEVNRGDFIEKIQSDLRDSFREKYGENDEHVDYESVVPGIREILTTVHAQGKTFADFIGEHEEELERLKGELPKVKPESRRSFWSMGFSSPPVSPEDTSDMLASTEIKDINNFIKELKMYRNVRYFANLMDQFNLLQAKATQSNDQEGYTYESLAGLSGEGEKEKHRGEEDEVLTWGSTSSAYISPQTSLAVEGDREFTKGDAYRWLVEVYPFDAAGLVVVVDADELEREKIAQVHEEAGFKHTLKTMSPPYTEGFKLSCVDKEQFDYELEVAAFVQMSNNLLNLIQVPYLEPGVNELEAAAKRLEAKAESLEDEGKRLQGENKSREAVAKFREAATKEREVEAKYRELHEKRQEVAGKRLSAYYMDKYLANLYKSGMAKFETKPYEAIYYFKIAYLFMPDTWVKEKAEIVTRIKEAFDFIQKKEKEAIEKEIAQSAIQAEGTPSAVDEVEEIAKESASLGATSSPLLQDEDNGDNEVAEIENYQHDKGKDHDNVGSSAPSDAPGISAELLFKEICTAGQFALNLKLQRLELDLHKANNPFCYLNPPTKPPSSFFKKPQESAVDSSFVSIIRRITIMIKAYNVSSNNALLKKCLSFFNDLESSLSPKSTHYLEVVRDLKKMIEGKIARNALREKTMMYPKAAKETVKDERVTNAVEVDSHEEEENDVEESFNNRRGYSYRGGSSGS